MNVLSTRVLRDRGVLEVEDRGGDLVFVWRGVDPLGRMEDVREFVIPAGFLDHLAGMLMDPTATDAAGRVTLNEPELSFVVGVKWEGEHRILEVRERGENSRPYFRVRLSPLEARRIAGLCERSALAAHFVAVLSKTPAGGKR